MAPAPRGARRVPRRGIRSVLSAILVAGFAIASPIVAPAAVAADYPSWDDVQNAKASTAAAADAVESIKALIVELQGNVEYTRAEAVKRTEEFFAAQQAYDDAVRRASEIQAQADAAGTEADTAQRNAGQVAAQLYRAGGTDVSLNLVLESGDTVATDKLLGRLGNMEKMVERTAGIYEEAAEKRNTAKALGDQALVAQGERETLRIAAEEALAAAQEAQAAAEAALTESQAQQVTLEAQLAFLADQEAKTTAAYEEGERKRKEEEERRRQEALRAGTPGTVASSGWALPASGWITGTFGGRDVICAGGFCSGGFHYGTDLGAGCSSPIYAANSGIVTFAGWSGNSWGNYVKIDHGGGISTAYAHIRDGGVFVSVGQWVEAGQNIASVGTTGASTGCHLHFEVWQGGGRINPIPFMADRGVRLG